MSDPPPSSDFSDELAGNVAASLFGSTYDGNPPSRLVARTANCAVVADYAPLVEGHVLVVPNEFRPSLAHTPRDQRAELVNVIEAVGAAVSRTYGLCVMIEHGSALGVLRRSSCVVHAHLHVLPVNVTFREALRERGVQAHDVADLSAALDAVPRECPYLLIRDSTGTYFVALTEDSDIPRQFARAHIAQALSIDDWDWNAWQNRDLLRATVRTLRPVLEPALDGRTRQLPSAPVPTGPSRTS